MRNLALIALLAPLAAAQDVFPDSALLRAVSKEAGQRIDYRFVGLDQTLDDGSRGRLVGGAYEFWHAEGWRHAVVEYDGQDLRLELFHPDGTRRALLTRQEDSPYPPGLGEGDHLRAHLKDGPGTEWTWSAQVWMPKPVLDQWRGGGPADRFAVTWVDDAGVPHTYGYEDLEPQFHDGELAGRFHEGRWECWDPGGWRHLAIGCDGETIEVEVFDASGQRVEHWREELRSRWSGGRATFLFREGQAVFFLAPGEVALELSLPRELWRRFGVEPVYTGAAAQVVVEDGAEDGPGDAEWDEEAYYDEVHAYLIEVKEEFIRRTLRKFRRALGHEDPFVRFAAAGALQNFGPDAHPALDELIEALEDPFPLVRLRAAAALANIGPAAAESYRALSAVLRSSEQDLGTRIAAAQALRAIGRDARPVERDLLELLAGDLPTELLPAVLAALGEVGVTDQARARRTVARFVDAEDGDAASEAWLTLWRLGGGAQATLDGLGGLLARDRTVLAAATRLGRMGREALPASDALAAALQQAEARMSADGSAPYVLARALNRVDPSSSALDGWSLGEGGPEVQTLELSSVLAYCMVEERPRAAVEAFVALLGYDATHAFDRHQLRVSVGPSSAAAVPGLIYLCGNNVIELRNFAIEMLGRIGEPALPALVAMLDDDNYLRRFSAPEAMALIGAPAVDGLIQALQGEEHQVASSLVGLASIGPSAAAAEAAIRVHLKHENGQVRDLARLALACVRAR